MMQIAKHPPAEPPGITEGSHQITAERVEELMQLKNQQEAAAKAARAAKRSITRVKPPPKPPVKRRRPLQRCK